MEFILFHLAFLERSNVCVPLYVICGCILVSLSLVGCLFAKFTLLSIKRRMILLYLLQNNQEYIFYGSS